MAKLYLSAVGAEFGTYRQQLRHRLLLEGHSVRTWDDLSVDPSPPAERLSAWLSLCDAVICLAGEQCGPLSPGLLLPGESAASSPPRSLSQAEFLLAQRLGKRVLLCLPASPDTPRDSASSEPDELRQRQRAFLAGELAAPGLPRLTFASPSHLADQVLAALSPQATPPVTPPLAPSPASPPGPAAGPAIAPVPVTGPAGHPCPFPGLRPFEEQESALFFGRNRLVEELLTQLEFQPMVLLLGASGSGKSSVLRAGVIPRWRAKYPGGRVVFLRPGNQPFESLADALASFPGEAAQSVRRPGPKVFRQLQPASASPADATPPPRILLAIDSFEELFVLPPTGADGNGREDFLDSLVDLARSANSGFQVLLALRDEAMSHLRAHEDFCRIADNSLQRITPVKGDALRECMEGPARTRAIRLEDGLAAELQEQSDSKGGMLPFLQDALATWWREEDLSGGVLRRTTLARIGGLQGALEKRLETWFATLPAEDQNAVQSTLLRLLDPSSLAAERSPTPRSAARSSLEETASPALIDALLDQARLLRRREGPPAAPPVLELAHAAIPHAWPRFRTWIEDRRSAASVRQRLQEDAGQWETARSREKSSLLWRGYRLEQALERQQRGDFASFGGLSPLETRFLRASARARSFRSLRDQALSLAAGMVAVASLGAALIASAHLWDANSLRRTAEAKAGLGWLARAESAEGSTDAGFFAALSTGFDGAGRHGAITPATLWDRTLAALPGRHRDPYPRYLTLQENPSRKIEADRRMSSAPKPFLWSAPFSPGDGPVAAVVFSLDGRRLASAGAHGRILLWSVATGNLERILDGSVSPVQDLDFSPAGTLLATGHTDGTLVLWDLRTGQKNASFQGHSGSVRAVAFSPGGHQVASGGDDGAIKVWGVEAAGETRAFAGHSGPVHCLAFGPGGMLLASGGSDRFVRVWDVQRGEEVNILSGHVNPVQALAFHPSGRELATSSKDQPVLLWDLDKHKSMQKLPLPGSHAQSLSFSPDGTHLALAGDDGHLRICTLGQDPSIRLYSGHSGAIHSLSFSPDGRIAATAGEDGTVKLWGVRDAWKNPSQPPAPAHPGDPSIPGASHGFDWFRYVREGWVHFEEHASAFEWRQLPQGLPYSSRDLPTHSWLGVLRGPPGPEQTRQLIALALAARNWQAAALLQGELPADASAAEISPGQAEAAAFLRLQVQDHLEAGQTDLAEWFMGLGDALFPRVGEWALLRGGYLEKAGDLQGALDCFRRLDRLEGWQAVARLSPDGREAVEAWRRTLNGEKEPPPARFLAAASRAAQAGQLPAVHEFLTAARQRFPQDRSLGIAFARQLVAMGDLEGAQHQFESLFPAGPGETEQKLVAVLREADSLASYLHLLHERTETLKSSGPEKAALESLLKLARLHLAANQDQEAILVLKDRIGFLQKTRQDASLSGPLDDLAKALLHADRRDEAFVVMRARIDLLKGSPPGAELSSALLELQQAYHAAGLAGEAIGVLQERVEVQRKLPGAPLSGLLGDLASALRDAGRPTEAAAVLQERVSALQAEGKDPVPAIRDWAEALATGGQNAEAWAAYKTIATLPQSPLPLLADVAYWGALHGFREEAMSLFDTAASQATHDSDRALIGRRRGWALLEAGAFEDAFRVLGMAKAQLESSPETAKLIESDLLSGLAAAFWVTGRKGASLDEYETLWQQQKADEHWEDAAFIRHRDLPEAGRKALLELHAIWHERMHLARTARPGAAQSTPPPP